MPKVVFVILHYLTYKDTFECVQSIKTNINYNNYQIVIVDNASNNNSFESLEDDYKDVEDIFLIGNSENLGFAKGNNVGYKFAKEKLNADYIVVINNDTIIQDNDFIKSFIDYYDTNEFHLLGPQIISLKDNCDQNPLKNIIDSKNKLIKSIIKYFVLYILNITKIEKIIKKVRVKNKDSAINNNQSLNFNNDILVNVPLHGACLIFSELYIKNMDYAFYPNTFLFVEEDILYYLCKKNNFKTCYFPSITIYHKEDSSTDFLLKASDEKRKFIYKNILKSCIEFYKII